MKVPFSPPDITEAEVESVAKVLRSGWITTGPMTKEFEKQLAALCTRPRAVCLNSATAAMEQALRLFEIGPGDEVITCAYTYTASASVAVHVGAAPILVDCLDGDPHIDPEAVRAAISPRTKAIIPVDIAGIPADYRALQKVVEECKTLFEPKGKLQKQLGRIAIIDDAAHSLGALYEEKSVALASDMACFSFHAVKNLTTAEGGCLVFGDIGQTTAEEIYRAAMLLSLHGQDKDALAKTRNGSWEYDILIPGYKCNMTDIMAALGVAQLERLQTMYHRRKEIVAQYNQYFEGSSVRPLRHVGEHFSGSHHLYMTAIEGLSEAVRNQVVEDLAAKEIIANVHYKPLPRMTAYQNMGFRAQDFPHAETFYQSEVTLPLHTLLSDDQVRYTARALLDALKTRVTALC